MTQSILRYSLITAVIFPLAMNVSAKNVRTVPGIKIAYDYGFKPGTTLPWNENIIIRK